MGVSTIDRAAARRFYDRFGARQDRQGWYEDAALETLIATARFGEAQAVVELGCGTGRLAERLLVDHLPSTATYLGFDISPTMVGLSRARLAGFGVRARVALLEGDALPALRPASCDRFLTTYVLDLLADEEIERALSLAAAALVSGGLLACAGLTSGVGLGSRLVMSVWRAVFRIAPSSVGGCRPMRIAPRLDRSRWEPVEARTVVSWGIASEVLVARRTADRAASAGESAPANGR